MYVFVRVCGAVRNSAHGMEHHDVAWEDVTRDSERDVGTVESR